MDEKDSEVNPKLGCGKALKKTTTEYSTVSTIQGVVYIFDEILPWLDRIFWILVVLISCVISIYMSIQSYINWQNNPVTTNIATTALPIEQVNFPAITICGQGLVRDIVQKVTFKYFRNYTDRMNISLDNMTSAQKASEFQNFLTDQFDGLNPENIVFLMTLPNPDSAVGAKVGVPGSTVRQPTPGEIGYCYTFINGAGAGCTASNSSTFPPPSSLFAALEEVNYDGVTTQAVYQSSTPLVDAVVNVSGFFALPTNQDGTPTISLLLSVTPQSGGVGSLSSLPCYSSPSSQVICISDEGQTTIQTSSVVTTTPAPDPNPGPTVDKFLNPDKLFALNNMIAQAKNLTEIEFGKVNMSEIFDDLFDILWYSQLPCFDVNGTTSNVNNQMAMIKQCLWKGKPINCAAIFKTFPTDRGMCCTFNMADASVMFKDSQYVQMVQRKQQEDLSNSFGNQSESDWYNQENQPTSKSGKNKGLTVILDAHSDIVESGTVNDDIRGFYVMIDDPGKYPMISQDSLLLPTGMISYVSIMATSISSDDSIRSISPDKRNCYFEDEIQLQLHKNYTRSNCILECFLQYAHNNTESVCTPWYFPTSPSVNSVPCDPWQTQAFMAAMANVPDNQCAQCLPDCTNTVYETSITSTYIRRCDNKNLGVSRLCTIDKSNVLNPPIWGEQTLEDYISTWNFIPSYVTNYMRTNKRKYISQSPVFAVQDQTNPTYNAYDVDIAVVNFFFKTPTVLQFGRQATMTWIDYLSNVGGIFGLFIGLSIVTLIEVVYWFVLRWIRNAMERNQVEPAYAPQTEVSKVPLDDGVGPAFYKPPMSPKGISLHVSDADV